jgi:two-component system phosphate regulon sensor histidine kinase PhoR
LGGVIIFQDLTPVKHLEKERRHLVNMFAHDLKTLVVGMAGLIQRLLQGKSGPLSEEQLSSLKAVDNSMQKLQDLITTFLEFARLDLRFLTPLPSAIPVEKECQEIISSVLPVAEAKGVALTTEFPPEILVLQAYPLLFRRVLENLLGNANKYALPQTSVLLQVERDEGELRLPSATRDLVYLLKTCLISSRFFAGARVPAKSRGSACGWLQSSGSSTPMAAASG